MAMTRLETAERRFSKAVDLVEAELHRSATTKAEIARSIALITSIENRAEGALEQLRLILRQKEGD